MSRILTSKTVTYRVLGRVTRPEIPKVLAIVIVTLALVGVPDLLLL